MSDPTQIEAMVKGTPLAAYLDPEAPQQRAGILSSMNMVADSLELLLEWEHQADILDRRVVHGAQAVGLSDV